MSITAVLALTSFAVQAGNAWANKKNSEKIMELQRKYQKEALEKNFEESKYLFNQMKEARMQMMEEERIERIRLMRNMHTDNLKSIAYINGLETWPLQIMPLVMKDDDLFGIENTSEESFTPINIIIGPGSDREFQTKIWKKVEGKLAERFVKFWSLNSNHPVIFYEDAWKNEREVADGIQFSNIHACIPNVPTLVFSPHISSEGLCISMSHWCITDIDPEKSYVKNIELTLPTTLHKYAKEDDYSTIDSDLLAEEISDILESTIGYIVDQYMWYKYNINPICPQYLNSRYNLNDASRAAFYHSYANMLSESLNSPHFDVVQDIPVILDYCHMIDSFGKGNLAIEITSCKFLGKKEQDKNVFESKVLLPSYRLCELTPFVTYVDKYHDSLSISKEFNEELKYSLALETAYQKSMEKILTDGTMSSGEKVLESIDCTRPLEKAYEAIDRANESIRIEMLERCARETEEGEDLRNWIRPKYRTRITAAYENMADVLVFGTERCCKEYNEKVICDAIDSVWDSAKEVYDFDSIDEECEAKQHCISRLKEFAGYLTNKVPKEFWKEGKIKDDTTVCLYDFCDVVLRAWVKYVFLGVDEINTSISDAQQEAIDESMKNVRNSLNILVKEYINSTYKNNNNDA